MSELYRLREMCAFHRSFDIDGNSYVAMASLDTDSGQPAFIFELLCNGDVVHTLREIDPSVLVEYGRFIESVNAWVSGAGPAPD